MKRRKKYLLYKKKISFIILSYQEGVTLGSACVRVEIRSCNMIALEKVYFNQQCLMMTLKSNFPLKKGYRNVFLCAVKCK